VTTVISESAVAENSDCGIFFRTYPPSDRFMSLGHPCRGGAEDGSAQHKRYPAYGIEGRS
jgi:hypothetical protein